MVSAFGPLLVPSVGIRFDQFFTYGLLPIAIGYLCIGRKTLISQAPAFYVLFIFSFVTLWTLVVTLGGVPAHVTPSSRTRLNELGSFENYLQIAVLVIILGIAIKRHGVNNSQLLLDKVGHIFIVLISVNAVIAMSSIFVDTQSFTKYFVQDNLGSKLTPFEVSSTIGRFSGIFDVPSAAGMAHSMALLIWTYLVRKKKRTSLISYLYGALIILGGAVTISKTFIFGGLPLFFIYWILPGRISSRITLKLLIVLAAIIGTVIVYLDSWIGFDKIVDLFTSSGNYSPQSLLFHFIEIRYGINNDFEFSGIFPYLWSVAPVHGLGFAYLGVADSAYLLYFMEGGLVSLFMYVGFIAIMLFVGTMEWFKGSETGRLLVVLGLFVLVAGIGAPVVTASRVNVIFWVILLLIMGVGVARRAEVNRKKTEDIH